MQPFGDGNESTRAEFDRRAPLTLRHLAPQESFHAQPAPNASSDMTSSAAAFVLFAIALGQASMQPNSEAAAAAQMLNDVSIGKADSAAGNDATADALTVEGNETGSISEAGSFVSRDAASSNGVSQDAGITKGACGRNSATAGASMSAVREGGSMNEADSPASAAAPHVNTEASQDAGISGAADAISKETAGGDAEEADVTRCQGHLSREEIASGAIAAESASRESSSGNAAVDSTSTAAAPSLAGTPHGPFSPQVAQFTTTAGEAQDATSAEGHHLAPRAPLLPTPTIPLP